MYGPTGRINDDRLIDGLSRDEVCTRYHDRIILIARKVAERLPPDCELGLEDLVGFGAIGLLEAFERFDPTRGILFSTFAEYRVRGSMMDALRQNDSFTRYRRQMARELQRAADDAMQDLGRAPDPEEVADYMGVDMETYWHCVNTTQPISHVSIDDGAQDDGGPHARPLAQVLMGSSGQEPFFKILNQQARDHLQEAIRDLSPRKRQCVVLYYGRGLTLREIAEVFDVTPSRISQILSHARRELREELEDTIASEDLSWEVQRGAEAL